MVELHAIIVLFLCLWKAGYWANKDCFYYCSPRAACMHCKYYCRVYAMRRHIVPFGSCRVQYCIYIYLYIYLYIVHILCVLCKSQETLRSSFVCTKHSVSFHETFRRVGLNCSLWYLCVCVCTYARAHVYACWPCYQLHWHRRLYHLLKLSASSQGPPCCACHS